jgi:hypothetical protein
MNSLEQEKNIAQKDALSPDELRLMDAITCARECCICERTRCCASR